MYLYDVLSTTYSQLKCLCSLPVLKHRSHSSLIPYCRVFLLISMIPLIRCQADTSAPARNSTTWHSQTSTSIHTSTTTTTTISQSTITSTTANNSSTSLIENSCPTSKYPDNATPHICQEVFGGGYSNIDVLNDTLYTQLQCNYSFFDSILNKYDCVSHTIPGKAPLRPYSLANGVSCDICKKYYKDWLCTVGNNYTADNGTVYRPCETLTCLRVTRACPYIHPNSDSYSSEPSFICNEKPDVMPCYYIATDNESEDLFTQGYTHRCNDTASNGTVCVLENSSFSIHRHTHNIAIVHVVLLMLIYQLFS